MKIRSLNPLSVPEIPKVNRGTIAKTGAIIDQLLRLLGFLLDQSRYQDRRT